MNGRRVGTVAAWIGRAGRAARRRVARAAGPVALALALVLAGCTAGVPSVGEVRTGVDEFRAGGEDPAPTPSGEYTPMPTATPEVSDAAAGAETGGVDNPWGERRIVVAVGESAAPGRDFTRAVRRAIAFWERNAEMATYPFDFVLRPNASDPDVVVNYQFLLDCEGHGEAAGCAPVLSADSDPPDPVVVNVKADLGAGLRTDTVTTIHELGHVLGLGHCDEPRWVMANGCADVADRPNATERETPWRDGTLSVYVDYRNVTAENRSATERHVRAVLDFYADGGNGTVPANLTFRRVADPYAADVVINWKPGGVGGTFGAWSTVGKDVDGDGAAEYHTRAAVAIDTLPVAERGFFLGWLLGKVLTPDGLPPEFAGGLEDVPWADDERARRAPPGARPTPKR